MNSFLSLVQLILSLLDFKNILLSTNQLHVQSVNCADQHNQIEK